MVTRKTFLKNATLGAFYPLGMVGGAAKKTAQKTLQVVCVGGHPDDPESGCGGTLGLYAKGGHAVTIVYLTRGEGGIAGKTHTEAAAIRTKEAEAACGIIGAKPVFFGQVDGKAQFDGAEIARMQRLLTTLKPDVLFIHWPVDSHPDHQVASMLSYQSWVRMGKGFPVYCFEVNSGDQTAQFTPTDYIDITAVADLKKKALYEHKSQDPDTIYFKHHLIMQQFRGREIGWMRIKPIWGFEKVDVNFSDFEYNFFR
jgi:LmbE family N-acetylglucosaminyl deacetylase